MRNFVLFTNTIFVMCALYAYSFIELVSDQLLLRDRANHQKNREDVHLSNMIAFFVMAIPELILPVLRPATALYGLYFIYSQSLLMFGHPLTLDSIYVLHYIAASFGTGTSLSYTLSYLYLTYQGFTKKELRSVENETGKRVRCVNPITGLRNMWGFYFHNSSDPKNGSSELQRQFSSMMTSTYSNIEEEEKRSAASNDQK